MSEERKLTTEELESLRNAVNALNSAIFKIGQIELSKEAAKEHYLTAESDLREKQEAIEKKYGPGNIDINTGVMSDLDT